MLLHMWLGETLTFGNPTSLSFKSVGTGLAIVQSCKMKMDREGGERETWMEFIVWPL